MDSGKKIDEYRLDNNQLSIRHLTVSKSGDVGVATQFQGELSKRPPVSLVAWQHSGGELNRLPMPKSLTKHLKGYIADIAYDDKNHQLAVTAPRGNQVLVWDLTSNSLIQQFDIREPSGIDYHNSQFILSNAQGAIYTIKKDGTSHTLNRLFTDKNITWDNHLITL